MNSAGADTSARLRPPPLRAKYVGLIGVFLVVEIGYHLAGIGFDAATLNGTWQYLDPILLRHDLLRSLWYLHSQPPVFNLWLGIVLKLAGTRWEVTFHLLYVACGLGFYIGTVVLMQRLGVRSRLAIVAATLFLVSPSFLLYEHWLFYTFPAATLILISVLALARCVERPSLGRAILFCSLLALLCGIESKYQIPYVLLVVFGVAVMYPRASRPVLYGASLPFALLCLLYVKNGLLFGVPSTSSWVGMSLAKVTVGYLPTSTLQALVTSGTISAISTIEPFSPPDAFPLAYFTPAGFDDAPAISARFKSTGDVNMNHIGYARVSREYLRDSLAVLRRYPGTLATASRDAWRIYGWSSSDNRFLGRNAALIAPWISAFDRVLYGRWRDSNVYVGLLMALSVAVVFGSAVLLSGERTSPQVRLLVAYALFNIVWVAVIGNSTEVGENNRFRFATDALSLAMITLMVQRVCDVFRAWGTLQ